MNKHTLILLAALPLAPLAALQAADLRALDLVSGGEPRAFFFRQAEMYERYKGERYKGDITDFPRVAPMIHLSRSSVSSDDRITLYRNRNSSTPPENSG